VPPWAVGLDVHSVSLLKGDAFSGYAATGPNTGK
jgi:hypothetical protein